MDGIDEAIAAVGRLGKSAPAALSDAINHTSNQSRIALQEQAASVFESPTRFTTNAFAVQPAKPGSDVTGSVFVKDAKAGNHAPEDWFEPQVFGGERKLKDSERKLQQMGILPAGMYTVPGRGARLDAYGNMSRQHIIQVLWGMRRLTTHGRSRRYGDKGREPFFVIRRNGKAIGIAEREGRSVKVVLAFTRQPAYAARFDFHAVVEKVADDNLLANIDQAIAKSLA